MNRRRVESTAPSSFAGHEPAERSQRNRVERAVDAFQTGIDRESSFRILYESYYRPLQRFFARKGLSPEESLDLTQETFFGIYKGLRTYRPEGRFDGWLYRLATTTYLKKLRAAATVKRSGEEVPYEQVQGSRAVGTTGGQLEGVLDEERRRAIRAAVRELPEQMRRCLILRIYHDLAYREIATIMRLKIDTVKAHLFQARKKLREKLSDLDLEEPDS